MISCGITAIHWQVSRTATRLMAYSDQSARKLHNVALIARRTAIQRRRHKHTITRERALVSNGAAGPNEYREFTISYRPTTLRLREPQH